MKTEISLDQDIKATTTMKFRLQYASNLFVTKHHAPVFPHFLKPNAPILALVGNIGNPNDQRFDHFFQWATNQWDTIVYVPGQLEQPRQTTVYESLKYSSKIHILTNRHPFFLFQHLPIALWTPETNASVAYRKLFLFSHKSYDNRVCLKHHATMYSHGMNGCEKDTYTNARGEDESPTKGYNASAIIHVDLSV